MVLPFDCCAFVKCEVYTTGKQKTETNRKLSKLAHTKTDLTPAQCFLNWNTSDSSYGFMAWLGSGAKGQCYSPE
jgi:hypothetical protein